jgi:uncharacterized repeat protein (TIGR01451 family)
MPRKKSTRFAQLLRRAIRGLVGSRDRHSRDHHSKRHLRFEPLETRSLLAGDLAGITGIVSIGGTPVVGASVQLFLDDGDSVFEPGAGDSQVGAAEVTNAAGRYTFDRLAAGNYWVRQPAQTVGAIDLGLAVSSLINISSAESDGILDETLDPFDDSPAQSVQAADVIGTIAASAVDNPNVVGDERDLIVELTDGAAGEFVQLDSQQNRLLITSTTNAQGEFTVVYDGNDDDGDTLNATGLGGIDLTDAGVNTAIKVRIRADQTGANLRLRLFTDATHFSDSQPLNFAIPGTNVDTDAIFYFEDFVAGTGAAGAASAASVGAMQMVVETTTDATNGRVTLLGVFRPTLENQDFENEADLSLIKTVTDDTPNVGDNITFTLTLANAGGAGATNVLVRDLLPVGLTFVSAAPSQGTTYDEQTGDWSVGTVAVGVNATLSITATVATPGVKINEAELLTADQEDPDSTPGNDAPAEDDQDSVTITPLSSDLSLTKDVNDATPTAGQQVVFTVTLNNAGPDAATGVVVRDLLPPGMTFVSFTASQGSYVSGTGLWSVGAVNSGGNATLDITATTTTSGVKTNTAEIIDADQNDPDSTPNNNQAAEDDQDSVTVTPEVADLSLTKDVDDATPTVGQDVVFTLTVTNGGPSAATGVVIEDLLPAGLTFVSATPSQGSYVSGTGIWTVGSINSAANATLTITATNSTGAVKINTTEVTDVDQFDSDSTPDNNVGTEDDQDSVTITPDVIDLAVTKTVDDDTPNLNQQVVFMVTVTNTGTIGATGVVVEDLLPAGLTFVSANASQGSYVNGTGVWTVGAIGISGNATLAITATATGTGTITNTAEVTDADQADRDSTPDNQNAGEDDQASEQVSVNQVDLSLTKTVNDNTPTRNQNITFTITVSNAGPANATGVVVEDLLPAGLTFVSSNPSQGTYVSATGVWTVGTINSTASATLEIVATATSSGVKVNTAEVVDVDQADSDSTPDNGVGTEDDQASATVTPDTADLSLTKTVTDNTPNRNQSITFTITLTNGGPVGATGVTVTDLLPAGLTFVSATPSVGSYSNTTGVWTVGNLANGANATLAIVATVNTIGAKTNTAEVTASNQFDADSTPGNNVGTEDDQASATVTPTIADLSLIKTVNLPNQQVGQNVVFTLTLANAGPDQATGVTVSDLLPAGLTFVSSTPSQGTYSATTGVWTVGTINSGANATLAITATVNGLGTLANTAQIMASEQFDSDSTPGNSQATEDDQSSISVTPPARFSKRLFLARPLP